MRCVDVVDGVFRYSRHAADLAEKAANKADGLALDDSGVKTVRLRVDFGTLGCETLLQCCIHELVVFKGHSR